MRGIQEIILVHHTHTDLGYTARCADVAVQQAQHLRHAIDLCRQQPGFHWTIESSWALEMFLRRASAEQKTALADLVRQGRIELTAFYTQPLTQLSDLEGLFASIEPTFELAREIGAGGIPVAMLDDVGGLSYNLPQVLRHFGTRATVLGCGGWRVMLPFTTLPHLFRLAGPDGTSVLCYHLGHRQGGPLSDAPAQYGFGMIYFLWPMLRQIDAAPVKREHEGQAGIMSLVGREGIDALLARLQTEGYPFNTLLLQVAADNYGPNPRLVEAIDAWNGRHRHPAVRLGTAAEFFGQVERDHGETIPTVQGEITCSWTEHATTHSAATAIYRRAARRHNTVCAVDACRAHPSPELPGLSKSIDRDLALYADHTFGLSMWTWEQKVQAYGSVWNDAFDLPRQTWDDKARYARRAWDAIEVEAQRQRIELSDDDPDAPTSLSILNPHSFSFSGLLAFATAQARIALRREDGAEIAVDSRPINSKWFEHRAWLAGIGPFATAMLDVIEPRQTPAPQFAADDWTLRGPGLRLAIDPSSGGIQSLVSESRRGDWVDAERGHLNEVLNHSVEGVLPTLTRCGLDESVTMHRRPIESVRSLGNGGGVSSAWLFIERRLQSDEGPVFVETQYRLDASGLRIRNRVKKTHTTAKEVCWFGFPFAMQSPFSFRVAQQGQVTDFPRERLPGASNHNLGMQDFLAATDEHSTALLISLDAPVVSLGRPTYYHFSMDHEPIDSAAAYSYAFGNLWNTNCPIHQHGELAFEYHIALMDGPFDAVTAYRAARSISEPAVVLPGRAHWPGLLSSTNHAVIVESVRPIAPDIVRVRLIEVQRQAQCTQLVLAPGRFVEFAVPERYDAECWQRIGEDRIGLSFGSAECKTLLLRRRMEER